MAEQLRFSVTELTELIRLTLEQGFSHIEVEGEISNCRPSSTGHLYFTLKDAGASISAVMFKNRLRGLSFDPKDGQVVRARGSISVYAQRGSYQIIVEELEATTSAGSLLLLLEERKRQLAAEGLFDSARKRALPAFPERVGVVSSPTGAALRDILNILGRRARNVDVIILPCPVQGAEAAEKIARRIEQANAWQLCDVLIVGRGGGSLEDLLPFSEECVVRAIAASGIPVVSAVGHEIDWALSDFAADLRAPTPSAAAELVSSRWEEVESQVEGEKETLVRAIEGRLERARLSTRPFRADEIEFRFRSILQPRLARFDDAKEDLCRALLDHVAALKTRVTLASLTLEAANPAEILDRGFSIVTDERGSVVRDAATLHPGSRLTIRPRKGTAIATVEEIR